MPERDIVIVGAGPVGLALALALRGVDAAIEMIGPRMPRSGAADARPIALSHGSRLVLERLGAWDGLACCPIERIHVSQRGGFGQVTLDAREAGLPALGYVVDYSRLAGALERSFEAGGGAARVGTVTSVRATPAETIVEYDADGKAAALTARLAVVAEGGALAARPGHARDYRQSVVSARVRCARPHGNVAYERFTEQGPLALLPAGEEMALVWSTAADRAAGLCELPEARFAQALREAFGDRLGEFTLTGPRAAYPVALRIAQPPDPRIIPVGNAAQTLHPVAGQGLNLGLRDAWELAAIVRERPKEALGTAAPLAAFRARRQLDRRGGILFTDALVRLFSNDVAPLRIARGLGLALLGAVPPAKDFLVRRMTFGARG